MHRICNLIVVYNRFTLCMCKIDFFFKIKSLNTRTHISAAQIIWQFLRISNANEKLSCIKFNSILFFYFFVVVVILGESNRRPHHDSHNRLFGDVDRPSATPKSYPKSNIPIGSDATDAPKATNGNGKFPIGNGSAALNGNGNAALNGNGNGVHENGKGKFYISKLRRTQIDCKHQLIFIFYLFYLQLKMAIALQMDILMEQRMESDQVKFLVITIFTKNWCLIWHY